MQIENTLPESRELWDDKTVAETVGSGVSTIWQWVRKGQFPKPVRKGPRFTRWYSDEVIDWMNSLPRA